MNNTSKFFLISRRWDVQPLLVVPATTAAEAIDRTARVCASVMDWIPDQPDKLMAQEFIIGHTPQPLGVSLIPERFFHDYERAMAADKKKIRPAWLKVHNGGCQNCDD